MLNSKRHSTAPQQSLTLPRVASTPPAYRLTHAHCETSRFTPATMALFTTVMLSTVLFALELPAPVQLALELLALALLALLPLLSCAETLRTVPRDDDLVYRR